MEGREEYLRAGRIAAQVRDAACGRVAPGASLLEIARFCDSEIERLGAKPAFPVNISVNEIAAHYTPFEGDGLAFGEKDLVKVDVGVQVDGFVADTAATVCLSPGHAELKLAAEDALAAAGRALAPGANVLEIGAAIEAAITARGFRPIYNLTGHMLKRYDLHAGLSIPNFSSGSAKIPEECALAIEPFATTGDGYVADGPPSAIFLVTGKNPRMPQEREALARLRARFSTLPFASRWVAEADRPMLARLAAAGCLHNYPILREKSRAPVSQAEHTFLISDGKVVTTTD